VNEIGNLTDGRGGCRASWGRKVDIVWVATNARVEGRNLVGRGIGAMAAESWRRNWQRDGDQTNF